MDTLLEGPVLEEGLSLSSCPGGAAICGEHGERLSFFCVDDLSPVCCECGVSDTHNGHRVYPIQEAVEDCKGELECSVHVLQDKVWRCDLVKQTCESAQKHILSQAQSTERQIKEEFEKLHQFLREEEEARIAALREEEEQKTGRIKEHAQKMDGMIDVLSETIREIEKETKVDGVDLQGSYESLVKRIRQCEQSPEKVNSSLINVSEHVGNLRFRVWNKMQQITPYTPVTLDPNTASSCLVISKDLRQVLQLEQHQRLPSVPERFRPYACLLGSEAMTSGRRRWDVDVGDSSNWTLGVAQASVKRGEEFEACPEAGLWTISLRRGQYVALTSPCQTLSLRGRRPRRIRVCVDWDEGFVRFVDPDCDTHLYTFTHTFTEPLLPYFESICKVRPLVILSQKVSVVTEKHQIPEDGDQDSENSPAHEEQIS
ncbi:E3 ubiquitin-protein ligase TRIM39-like [Chanos chanos]|uniref:E3 ubiquitin-protein ligase TRIM39-like n=1 Tax=Chanos chanos TaxID=29144 RepID=A0A6J2WX93_CHACN|nr:E3 ubiquitin-protein ligase TRIM39-like [Chanos chanos]